MRSLQPVFDHYSTYALDGSTGDLRWKHEPGDFEVEPAYYLVCGCGHKITMDTHIKDGARTWLSNIASCYYSVHLHQSPPSLTSCKDSGFRHFKLDDHSQRLHSGELSWQQFKTSFGTVMVGEYPELCMYLVCEKSFVARGRHASSITELGNNLSKIFG